LYLKVKFFFIVFLKKVSKHKIALIFLLCSLYNSNIFALEPISNYFGEGGSLTGKLFQIMIGIAVLSIAPSCIMMVTSFTRIAIVLSFLRSAIGLQQSPPNSILITLALFLTGFIMEPTFTKAYKEGLSPMIEGHINDEEGIQKTLEPFREFIKNNVRQEDVVFFHKIRKVETTEEDSISILIPAFMLSELRRSFEIGFYIFVPFLVIDIAVSSVLMSMGMMMLPPASISLPFKVLFFAMIDGWNIICGSLIKSFNDN
jgi:flagellar biosynthesis protein FliP